MRKYTVWLKIQRFFIFVCQKDKNNLTVITHVTLKENFLNKNLSDFKKEFGFLENLIFRVIFKSKLHLKGKI